MRAVAGPTGAVDPSAARATGFPGAYLRSVSLSMANDPLYGTRFLDGLDLHLRSVSAMTASHAVSGYLDDSVMGAQGVSLLSEKLGAAPLDPAKASALLVAHALTRPAQFREVLDGLEAVKAGLGQNTARLLRQAKGTGDKRLLKVLRAAGEPQSRGTLRAYGMGGGLSRLFDGAAGASSSEVVVPDSRERVGPRALPVRLD